MFLEIAIELSLSANTTKYVYILYIIYIYIYIIFIAFLSPVPFHWFSQIFTGSQRCGHTSQKNGSCAAQCCVSGHDELVVCK